MPDLRLIGPLIRSTPAGIKRALGQSRALPNDLLREASRRLGITALLVAVLWTVATIADHLAIRMQTHGSPRWLELGPDEAFAAIGISGLARAVRVQPQDRSRSRVCARSAWSTWW